jgi:hypothetical protein
MLKKTRGIKMNRNLNVFWGLVLCVGMIGGLIVLSRRGESGSKNGNPNEFYNSSSARTYSHVSSSAAVADGVGVPMSSTSAMRRGSSFVYAPAYTAPAGPIASSPNGPIASSPITYTSSSAMTKSFGSGMGAGVSMSGGAVRSTGGSVSMSAGGGISSPISLPSREGTGVGFNNLIASSPVTITDPAAAAASYEGIGNTTGGPRGIRGRQKAAPGFEDTWWVWLDNWVKSNGERVGQGELGTDGYYTEGYLFDCYDLAAAYEEFKEYCWNSGMGTPPSFEEWLDWYQSTMSEDGYMFNDHKYTWLPIGNILPLLVFALIYMAFLCLKALRVTNSSVEK